MRAALRREHPHHALLGAAALVEAHADSDLAIAFALARFVGHHLAQRLALEVGQLEVLEHDVDELLEGDIGLVVIDAGFVSALALVALAGLLTGLADHLALLGIAIAGAGAGSIFAEHEAILLDAAQRDLDHAVLVFADDGFLGDDVGDILADGFPDLLAMAQAVAGGAVRAFGLGRFIVAEN